MVFQFIPIRITFLYQCPHVLGSFQLCHNIIIENNVYFIYFYMSNNFNNINYDKLNTDNYDKLNTDNSDEEKPYAITGDGKHG